MPIPAGDDDQFVKRNSSQKRGASEDRNEGENGLESCSEWQRQSLLR